MYLCVSIGAIALVCILVNWYSFSIFFMQINFRIPVQHNLIFSFPIMKLTQWSGIVCYVQCFCHVSQTQECSLCELVTYSQAALCISLF